MIDLYHGELINMEPTSLASGIEEQCVSYALKQVTQLIIDKAKTTRTQAVIDELPEPVLDLLASELRTPYYLDSMDIETKRNIIKRTVPWHFRAGTPSAVAELIMTVFGEGRVIEWFDFDPADGEIVPGQFDIETNAIMTPDAFERFQQIIRRVKNERSHLRRIMIDRLADVKEAVGAGSIGRPEAAVPNHLVLQINGGPEEAAGAGAIGDPDAHVGNNLTLQINGGPEANAGAGASAEPETEIPNNLVFTRQADEQRHVAAAAFARPLIYTN